MADGVSRASFDGEPENGFVRLRDPLGVTTFGINKLVLARGQRNLIHRHKHQEEVYLVLEGTLTLIVEGEPEDVGPGEAVRLAPEVRRQLVNRGPGELTLLALGGMVSHEHVPRDGEAFASWEDTEPTPRDQVQRPGPLPESELR